MRTYSLRPNQICSIKLTSSAEHLVALIARESYIRMVQPDVLLQLLFRASPMVTPRTQKVLHVIVPVRVHFACVFGNKLLATHLALERPVVGADMGQVVGAQELLRLVRFAARQAQEAGAGARLYVEMNAFLVRLQRLTQIVRLVASGVVAAVQLEMAVRLVFALVHPEGTPLLERRIAVSTGERFKAAVLAQMGFETMLFLEDSRAHVAAKAGRSGGGSEWVMDGLDVQLQVVEMIKLGGAMEAGQVL